MQGVRACSTGCSSAQSDIVFVAGSRHVVMCALDLREDGGLSGDCGGGIFLVESGWVLSLTIEDPETTIHTAIVVRKRKARVDGFAGVAPFAPPGEAMEGRRGFRPDQGLNEHTI